jgi:hypothetical protein
MWAFDDAYLQALAAALKPHLATTAPDTGSSGPDVVSPPPPPPPPVNGLADFFARPGQWAKYSQSEGFWKSAEFVPLQNYLVQKYGMHPDAAYVRINQQIQAYNSTIKVSGRRVGNVFSYYNWKIGMFLSANNGEADSFIAETQPTAVPNALA